LIIFSLHYVFLWVTLYFIVTVTLHLQLGFGLGLVTFNYAQFSVTEVSTNL